MTLSELHTAIMALPVERLRNAAADSIQAEELGEGPAALAALAQELLQGVPYHLARSAITLLRDTHIHAAESVALLKEAPALWSADGLCHPNREVRSGCLLLLKDLAPFAHELPTESLRSLAASAVPVLCTVLSEQADERATAAAAALRKLTSTSPGVAACVAGGLTAALLALPPRCRQPPLGETVVVLLLRAGILGAPAGRLRSRDAGGCGEGAPGANGDADADANADAHDAYADCAMAWGHGGRLPLQRALLEARAPSWAAKLVARAEGLVSESRTRNFRIPRALPAGQESMSSPQVLRMVRKARATSRRASGASAARARCLALG